MSINKVITGNTICQQNSGCEGCRGNDPPCLVSRPGCLCVAKMQKFPCPAIGVTLVQQEWMYFLALVNDPCPRHRQWPHVFWTWRCVLVVAATALYWLGSSYRQRSPALDRSVSHHDGVKDVLHHGVVFGIGFKCFSCRAVECLVGKLCGIVK